MKIDRWLKKLTIIGISIFLVTLAVFSRTQSFVSNKENELSTGTDYTIDSSVISNKILVDNSESEEEPLDNSKEENIVVESTEETVVENTTETVVANDNIINNVTLVYDGFTLDEVINKLNKSLNSTLSGYGELFASYSLEYGLNPFLTAAIALHETGCTWNCSELVKACNNVGGVKGSPSCGGGAYRAYATLEEGIKSYIDNIYNNYYSQGLITAEQMNSKYAASTTWATKVNTYVENIKAN